MPLLTKNLTSTRRFSARPASSRSLPRLRIRPSPPAPRCAESDATLLDQKGDHGFSAVLAQFRVHRGVAGRVGIARHLDDVSRQVLWRCWARFLSSSWSSCEKSWRCHVEFRGCFALHVIFAQRSKATSVHLDAFKFASICSLRNILLVGFDVFFLSRQLHLVASSCPLWASRAFTLAATCCAVGCKPAWIISAASRSSPSTVMVFATTRPDRRSIRQRPP